MSSKYRFLFQTSHPNNRTSELVLAETNSRDRAAKLRLRIAEISGIATKLRTPKKVVVMEIDAERFRVFHPEGALPRKGQVFESIDALALFTETNPSSLRAELCRLRGGRKQPATVKGITYAYVKAQG